MNSFCPVLFVAVRHPWCGRKSGISYIALSFCFTVLEKSKFFDMGLNHYKQRTL
jgi:hypothetical protein